MEQFISILALWPYFLIALAGAFMHIIKKWAKLESKDRTFNVSGWLKENKWRTILGILIACGGVVMLDGSDSLSIPASLLLGYTGDSLLKKEKK